jgi:hypothetical protein
VNGDGFGDLVVGAPGFDDLLVDEGRVSVYLGSSGGLASTPSWTRYGRQAGAHFGAKVVAAGDVNGDGFADVVVSAPDLDRLDAPSRSVHVRVGSGNEGAIFVFHGSPEGLSAAPRRTVMGIERGEHFGSAIAGAGDVNGDGYDDVLVGAVGKLDRLGGVFLFAGSPAGLRALPGWMRLGSQVGEGWGSVLGTVGDIDRDGDADFLVAAPLRPGGCGATEFFLGSPLGPGSSPDRVVGVGMTVIGPSADLDRSDPIETLYVAPRCEDDAAGWRRVLSSGSGAYPALADARAVTIGDLNGDGRSDVIVGAPDFRYASGLGRVWVYTNLPGHTFESLSPFPVFDGDQAESGWGAELATIDVDGDGADELFIGAPEQDEGEADEGMVVLVRGRRAEVDLVPVLTIPSMLGDCASGDFNGDGFDDLAANAGTYYTVNRPELRYGSPSGLPQTEDVVLSSPPQFNSVVAGFAVGDYDGDGFDDLFASYFRSSGYGRVVDAEQWLFLGGPSGLQSTAIVVATQRGNGHPVGDVNGDGRDDVLISRDDSTDLHLGMSSGVELVPSQVFTPLASYLGAEMLVGNLNGDLYRDVVFVRSYGTRLSLMTGSPSGLVLQRVQTFPAETRFDALLDMDGDGLDDLLLAHKARSSIYPYAWQWRIWRGSPDGFVRAEQWWEDPLPISDYSDELSFGYRIHTLFDADRDGHLDFLMAGNQLLRGSAYGLERAPIWSGPSSPIPPGTSAALMRSVAGDFDGDGRIEVVGWTNDFVLRIHEVQER